MFRRRQDEDFAAEIEAHVALERERLVDDGMDPADADAAAKRRFGNATAARERYFESVRWVWLEQFRQDLRYAAVTLRGSPAFLLTTVLTLAVGLCLVTIAFSVFNAYFLRPFAVRDPASLYQVGWRSADDGTVQFRWRDFEALRGRTDLFDDAVAEHNLFVSSNGRPLAAALVSGNYFEMLSPPMRLGRPLAPIDASGSGAVVLGEAAWRRLYDGDPSAIGREIDVDGRLLTIVGVADAAFGGLGDPPNDLWILLPTYAAYAAPALTGADQRRAVEVIARLRSDLTPAQAAASLAEDINRIAGTKARARATVEPHGTPNPLSIQAMVVLSPVFVAFGLVLVAACANVSNVMLARAAARQREIAVRLALGAGRGRIVRQLLAEGLVVAALAGVAGLVLTGWALRAVVSVVITTLPPGAAALIRFMPMSVDTRVFAFALVATAAATVLFALVPALQASRPALTSALQGQRTGTPRPSRLRSGLIAMQVGVSLLLVITAITIARNGRSIARLELGFDPRGVTSVNIRGDETGLLPGLVEALAAEPEIGDIAVTNGNPLFVMPLVNAGPLTGRPPSRTPYRFVSPEFFPVLRIPIARGRAFTMQEAASGAPVAIVSEATAAAFWPGRDPLGQVVRLAPATGRRDDTITDYSTVTVVGVVRDVVSGIIVEGVDTGHLYLPMSAASPHAKAVLLRGRAERTVPPETLERVFTRAARTPQVFEALPFEEIRDLQVYPVLAAAWVGTGLAAVALALSIAGLYGVLAYTIGQRTREIGIRIALGATPGGIVGLVVRHSARLAGVGALAGLLVAFGLMRVLDAKVELHALSFLDPAAFAAGIAIIGSAVVIAAMHPSWQATRVDPAESLRVDG